MGKIERSTWLRSLFFPPRCGGCGDFLPVTAWEEALCPDCRGKWELAKLRECPVCHEAQMDCLCGTETLSEAGIGQLIKLVAYRSDVKRDDVEFAVQNRLLYRIKDRHVWRYERFLARQLALRLRPILVRGGWDASHCVITFCPRGKAKRQATGTDQSERMARYLSRELGIPFARLLRRAGGEEQKTKNREQRAVNAIGGFTACRGAFAADMRVILLDDIVTTGASMAACAEEIWKMGAVGMIGVAVAQT